jgi:hypothetical protein
MNLTDLAKAVEKSVPFVITLQRKHGLPRRDEYSEGYAVLVKKLVYLSLCSVTVKDVKALLNSERGLLELLKVDSLHDAENWFELLCTMKCGPTRLLLTGYDIGHPISGEALQTGLDFSEREKELFEDSEMGADALRCLKRYAETVVPIRHRIESAIPTLQQTINWCREVVKTD